MSRKTPLHKAWFSLTVSEGKRLIALGLRRYTTVSKCLDEACLVITKGTTNTYVVESLLGAELANGDYVNGHILPADSKKKLDKPHIRPEYVLEKGRLSEKTFPEVLEDMGPDDVVLKGANIINYDKRQAGVIIVHPTGGTCGTITPAVEKNHLKVVIPVGLEKDSSFDIPKLAVESKRLKTEIKGNAPYVWPLEGELFTEIEALKTYADVDLKVIGKGGIGGAEGAISFVVTGKSEELEKALAIVKQVQGEKEYIK